MRLMFPKTPYTKKTKAIANATGATLFKRFGSSVVSGFEKNTR